MEPFSEAAWSATPAEPFAPRPTPAGKDVPCGVHAPSVAAVRKRWKIAEVPDRSPRETTLIGVFGNSTPSLASAIRGSSQDVTLPAKMLATTRAGRLIS